MILNSHVSLQRSESSSAFGVFDHFLEDLVIASSCEILGVFIATYTSGFYEFLGFSGVIFLGFFDLKTWKPKEQASKLNKKKMRINLDNVFI